MFSRSGKYTSTKHLSFVTPKKVGGESGGEQGEEIIPELRNKVYEEAVKELGGQRMAGESSFERKTTETFKQAKASPLLLEDSSFKAISRMQRQKILDSKDISVPVGHYRPNLNYNLKTRHTEILKHREKTKAKPKKIFLSMCDRILRSLQHKEPGSRGKRNTNLRRKLNELKKGSNREKIGSRFYNSFAEESSKFISSTTNPQWADDISPERRLAKPMNLSLAKRQSSIKFESDLSLINDDISNRKLSTMKTLKPDDEKNKQNSKEQEEGSRGNSQIPKGKSILKMPIIYNKKLADKRFSYKNSLATHKAASDKEKLYHIIKKKDHEGNLEIVPSFEVKKEDRKKINANHSFASAIGREEANYLQQKLHLHEGRLEKFDPKYQTQIKQVPSMYFDRMKGRSEVFESTSITPNCYDYFDSTFNHQKLNKSLSSITGDVDFKRQSYRKPSNSIYRHKRDQSPEFYSYSLDSVSPSTRSLDWSKQSSREKKIQKRKERKVLTLYYTTEMSLKDPKK
ncbi:unnamed protein product [Moneuplotes crassus]|uniref:Uncharacterized protein n=1 Tax=Euplotes crassus TaxID=5936 RepID=A0AAD1X1P9_EUPCR|nr:unnamed protein product [Moneuplotes crassus]